MLNKGSFGLNVASKCSLYALRCKRFAAEQKQSHFFHLPIYTMAPLGFCVLFACWKTTLFVGVRQKTIFSAALHSIESYLLLSLDRSCTTSFGSNGSGNRFSICNVLYWGLFFSNGAWQETASGKSSKKVNFKIKCLSFHTFDGRRKDKEYNKYAPSATKHRTHTIMHLDNIKWRQINFKSIFVQKKNYYFSSKHKQF